MKNNVMRILSILLAVVMMILIAPSIALAATTADVVVTATPTYIALTNTPSTYDFAGVLEGVNKNTSATYFTANNTGTVTSNISITAILTGGNWSGGKGWIHSNTATAGAEQAGLIASIDAWTTNISVSSTATWFKVGLVAATTQTWGLTLVTPTVFGDGVQKTMTVRLSIYQQ